MKKCFSCGASYISANKSCSACAWHPEIINGFPAYAPELAVASSGFKASYFADLVKLEERHFWFRARNRLVVWALGKYCTGFKSFLEIGCGTGYVLSGVRTAYPKATFFGSEIFSAGLSLAKARQPAVELMQMDARNIPFVDEFDVIGAFDVLEHIEEDEKVLQQMHQALMPHGHILITVPQHVWLWSPVDDYACHVRRYSAKELHAKIVSAGFEIVRSTSFVSSLLPAMWFSRYLKRGEQEVDAASELKISGWLNFLFEMILNIEILLIKCGFGFMLGGSRLVVARKQ